MRSRSPRYFILLSFFVLLFSQAPLYSENQAVEFYKSGLARAAAEDWYGAAEYFLEALSLNPRYADPIAALAECYFALEEYDQALSWVRQARKLRSSDFELINLEAAILIALGDFNTADLLISDLLRQEPYNKEALFTAAELDLAMGKIGEAAARYRSAVQRYPDDRNALLSLALVLGSLGQTDQARAFADRAVKAHPDDYKTLYYSAYLDSISGDLDGALDAVQRCLLYKSDYRPALSLLAPVQYRREAWAEAAQSADRLIALDRLNVSAWYLKALAFVKLGMNDQARSILKSALSIDPNDEFVRASWERLLLSDTGVESIERMPAAAYHFAKAAEYQERNFSSQALFEYRRGLRLNPYAAERKLYADLLGAAAYPARQLAELRFIQELGMSNQVINDAIEAYDSLLSDALHRRWGVEPDFLDRRHWTVAVMTLGGQSGGHVDAGETAAQTIRDYLVHDGSIAIADVALKQSSFAAAFQEARLADADYFFIISLKEGNRDLALSAELYVARTGSHAASYSAYRTGGDRLRDAARIIVDKLNYDMPFRARLLIRKSGQGIIDKGRIDGVQVGQVYDILMSGTLRPAAEGLGLAFVDEDIIGSFTVDETDEEISLGTISRKGFYDKVAEGDTLIANQNKQADQAGKLIIADPELRRLLRSMR